MKHTSENELAGLMTTNTDISELAGWIKSRLGENSYNNISIEALRQNLELISRFSFRTISA